MSDLISREKVLSAYADWYGYGYNNGFYRLVQQMPSVEPERKTGKWIHVGDGGYCSECGHDMPWFFVNWNYAPKEMPFCPNCDAKMEVNG